MKLALFCCLISFFLSCRSKDTTAILPPEKMEAVLLDFMMTEAYTNTHVNIDSVLLAQKENVKLQKKVFAIHGITREEFKLSVDYYTRHSAQFAAMLDSISAKENRRNAASTNIKYE